MTPITLSSISSKLDEIKEIVNNTYTNTNINNTSFADALKKSIEPTLNIITNKINKTDNNNTKYPQLDNKRSCTIEHIDVKNCNNEYIKSLLVLLDINLTSITNVYFLNYNYYIYFTNSFSKLEFLNCVRLLRSKLVDTVYT